MEDEALRQEARKDTDESRYVKDIFQKLMIPAKEQIAKGNLRKAKAVFQYSYKKAKLINSHYYQGISLLNLAAIHIIGKKPEVAIDYLNAALKLGLPLPELGDAHHNLAVAHDMLNHQGDAAKEYDLALALYKQAKISKTDVSNLSVKVGMFFMKLKKHKKAIEYFNLSVGILSEKELIVQLATVLCMKSRCLMASDRTVSEAIQVCEECMKLCKSVEQDAYVVHVYNELGLILTQSKEFEKSSSCYKLALEVCEEVQHDVVSQEKKAALMQNLGAVLNSLGKFKEAVEYSQRAAEIYGLVGVRSSQCHCFLNIAFSFSQLNTVSGNEKTEEYYLHALQAAKDTSCLRDQWQSLEGLGGVALTQRQFDKAAELYQKAIGICPATGSNTKEQDRLVRKLSAALKSRLPSGVTAHMGPGPGSTPGPAPGSAPGSAPGQIYQTVTPQRAATLLQPYGGLPQVSVLSPTQSIHLNSGLIATDFSLVSSENLRPANLNARREDRTSQFSEDAMDTADSENSNSPKRRRTKHGSQRSDRDLHPIHGTHEILVHRGLGRYETQEDQRKMFHLSPEDIVRKGRRRENGEDVLSVASGRLHIQGLAVDDPSEPRVAVGIRRGDDFDGTDSLGVIQVRPMSRNFQHRQSRIMDADQTESDDDTCGRQSDSIEEAHDLSLDSTQEDSSLDTSARSTRTRKDTTVENKTYGSIIRPMGETAKFSTLGKGLDKGKRPMSAKPVYKSSRVQAEGNGEQTPTAHTTLLLDSTVVESDEDTKAVMDRMRTLNNLDSSASDEEETKEQTGRDSHEETSMGSEDDLPTPPNEKVADGTYETPGGNFFKEKSKGEPDYDTIRSAHNSAPTHNAPPKLPPRNYKNDGSDDFAEASDSDTPDINQMTRGERDSYLYERQKLKSEKIVKYEGRSVKEVKGKTSQQSQVCSVM